MKKVPQFLAFAAFFCWPACAALAVEPTLLENRWKGTVIDASPSGLTESDNASNQTALWLVEPVGHQDYKNVFRLRSAVTGDYLNIETGDLQVGQIDQSWHSAMWTLEKTDDGFVRFKNYWKQDVYIHNEGGGLGAGTIKPGWHSAQWSVKPNPNPDAAVVVVEVSPQQPMPTTTRRRHSQTVSQAMTLNKLN